jgi:hypothetical protein
MDNNVIREYLGRLSSANSDEEIDKIIDEIVPLLRGSGISPTHIALYFKMYGDNAIPKSQDHQNSFSNANKAQVILQKLMSKLKS